MSSQPNLDTLYMQANQMRAELNALRRLVDGMTNTASRNSTNAELSAQLTELQERVSALEAAAAG